MARTVIALQDIPSEGHIADITMSAADAANNHELANNGKVLLLVNNADAGPHEITIVSVADFAGRFQDIVQSVVAGDLAIFGPFKPAWWNQAGGLLHINLDTDTAVTLAALRIA
jgi:hypothetical protein